MAAGIIDEHARDRGLATGNQVGVRRNLLEQMALAGSSRTEFNHVVVSLHKRNHAEQHHVLSAGSQLFGFHADAADQKLLPFVCGKCFPAFVERRQHLAFGQLNFAKGINAEWATILLLSNRRVVREFDFSVETAGQHPFVGVNHCRTDPHVFQLQTGQRDEERIGGGIQSSGDDVNQLHVPLVFGTGLEQFVFAGTNRLFAKLAFDNLEAFSDFFRIDRGAITAKEEFGHVGWNRVLSLELAHQILAHDVAFKFPRGDFVNRVHLFAHDLILQQ